MLKSIDLGESVDSIAERAFSNCSKLESIAVKSIRKTGLYVFDGCSKLVNLHLKDIAAWCGSKELGRNYYLHPFSSSYGLQHHIFYNGEEITSLSIPSTATKISEYAFYYCNELMSVEIPSSVKEIADYAFCKCEKLSNITIAPSVTKISSAAFAETAWINSQTDGPLYLNNVLYSYRGAIPSGTTLNIKNGCISIADDAFENCTNKENLVSITIPNTVTTIGERAFYECSGLTSLVIPNSVTEVGRSAFSACSGLKSVQLSNSLKEINYYTFGACSSLSSITIPSSIKTIGDNTFYGCTNLSTVKLGTSVTSVGESAFYGCTKLTSITIPENVISIGKDAFLNTGIYNNQEDGLWYVDKWLCGYKGTLQSGYIHHVNIPEGCVGVANSAFCNNGINHYFSNLTMGNSVKYIGDNAFAFAGVSIINLSESLVRIGNAAFISSYSQYSSGSTTRADNLVIPNSVEYIGNGAFDLCRANNVVIGSGIKEIGSYAFDELLSGGEKGRFVCYSNTVPISKSSPFKSGGTSSHDQTTDYYVLCVPYEAYNEYKSNEYWGKFVNITVIPTEIVLSGYDTPIIIGNNRTIELSLLPEAAFCDSFTWTSSNEDVATVSSDGVVTAIAPGTATITAATTDGTNLSASCEITVKEVPIVPITTDISYITNTLYSAEKKTRSGSQIILPIYMKNSNPVTLFQTNVYLPEGFSFAKKTNGKYAVSLIKDRLTDEDDNHVISANLQADGSLLILCSSQDNYTFDGNDGLVATVTIDVADNVSEGQYLIKLNNQKLVKPDNSGTNITTYQVVTTVKNITLGDVNDDGDIDGYDLVGISNLILGTNTSGLNRDAADVNNDGEVDGYDYVMEVNTILGSNSSSAKGSRNTDYSENALSSLVIEPVNVSIGGQTQMNIGIECNGDVFTLVQTDIEFPDGIEPMLKNGRVVVKLANECVGNGDNHSISCIKQSDGKYRVLIMSQDNTGFNRQDGQLFTVGIETVDGMSEGLYDITLSNTKLVRANNTGVNPADCHGVLTCSAATGINNITDEETSDALFNLNGQRVSKHAQRGIYISNGKKTVKK